MAKTPQALSENGWFNTLTARSRDALVLSQREYESSYFRDFGQSLGRVHTKTTTDESGKHAAPTLLPSHELWIDEAARLRVSLGLRPGDQIDVAAVEAAHASSRMLLGIEALMFQGFPALQVFDRVAIPDDLKRDLAGNAMALPALQVFDRVAIPDDLMRDLAGNAMALPVVLAVLQSACASLT
eukprot:4328155-Amphidinium_carterae.1